MRKSYRVSFPNHAGDTLVGVLDTCDHPRFYAIFSHCFTCSKDLKAIVRISRVLAEGGIAVLRYDYTGLGDSHGEFQQTNFTTTCLDTICAAEFLRERYEPPQLLIGHSLGGTASYQVAERIDAARAVVTIASPSCTTHLSDYLAGCDPEIDQRGFGSVVIGNRPVPITAQLMQDLRTQDIPQRIRQLRLPLLLIHSPDDETLSYRHSVDALHWTAGRSSLLTLPGSDHLLTNQPEDIPLVGRSILAWADRYCGSAVRPPSS
jgi:uncharacterized protein